MPPTQRGKINPALLRRRWSWEAGGGIAALFSFSAGQDPTTKGGTFTRAGNRTYDDTSGVVQTATTGVFRGAHYLGGVQHFLLEPARTNSTLRSEDLTNAAWTKIGSTPCTIGGSVTAPDNTAGVTTVGIIGANGAFTVVGVVNAAAYTWTLNTPQAWSCFAKPGNKSNLMIRTTNKAVVTADSWVNVSTGAVGTTAATHIIKTWPLANGWYRIELQLTTSSTPATGGQTVSVGYSDADNSTTLTGDGSTVNGYVWGIHHEQDLGWVSSYIPTTSAAVTAVADQLQFTYTDTTNFITVFSDFTEIGTVKRTGATFPAIVHLGGAVGATPNCFVQSYTGTNFACVSYAGNTSPLRGATAQPGGQNLGDHNEARGWVNADFTPQGGISVNGAAETAEAAGAAADALGASWNGNVLIIGRNGVIGVVDNCCAIRSVKTLLGSNVPLATCRSAT